MKRKATWVFLALCLAVLPGLLAGRSAARAENGETDEVLLPVLMYHSVCAGAESCYVLSPKTLESDFSYLVRSGYHPVTFSQVYAFCAEGRPLPDKPVMLTFDDGHYNFLSEVVPLVERFGFAAGVSVVKAYSEKEPQEAKRSCLYSYLSPAELTELSGHERIDIYNHSDRLHRGEGAEKRPGERKTAYIARIESDIRACDGFLRECGASPEVLVLPFGKFSAETEAAVRAAGYKGMMTCEERVNRLKAGDTDALFRLRRFNRPGCMQTEQFFKKIK